MSYSCQKCKKVGVTQFVSEIRYLKEDAYLEKFDFVTRYDICGFWRQNILNELMQANFIVRVYFSGSMAQIYISLLTSLRGNLVFNNCICKHSKQQNVTGSIAHGKRK